MAGFLGLGIAIFVLLSQWRIHNEEGSRNQTGQLPLAPVTHTGEYRVSYSDFLCQVLQSDGNYVLYPDSKQFRVHRGRLRLTSESQAVALRNLRGSRVETPVLYCHGWLSFVQLLFTNLWMYFATCQLDGRRSSFHYTPESTLDFARRPEPTVRVNHGFPAQR